MSEADSQVRLPPPPRRTVPVGRLLALLRAESDLRRIVRRLDNVWWLRVLRLSHGFRALRDRYATPDAAPPVIRRTWTADTDDVLVVAGRGQHVGRPGVTRLTEPAPALLRHHLRLARVLVLLDPWSFPYQLLTPVTWATPRLIWVREDRPLPSELVAQISPSDRFVATDSGWRHLQHATGLGDGQRVGGTTHDANSVVDLVAKVYPGVRYVQAHTPFGLIVDRRNGVIMRNVLEQGAQQRSDLSAVLDLLRDGDTAIDIGAHVGTFSVPMGNRVGPQGRVHAFEAGAENAALLATNITLNALLDVVVPVSALVSDRGGLAYTSRHGDAGESGMVYETTDGHMEPGPLTVDLDSFFSGARALDRLDLVKVDVEGMELTALRGARQLLERHRPALFVEVGEAQLASRGASIEELDDFLSGLGYRFMANILPRNARGDAYELMHVQRLTDHADRFYDVLAVHRDSQRMPSALPPGSGTPGQVR